MSTGLGCLLINMHVLKDATPETKYKIPTAHGRLLHLRGLKCSLKPPQRQVAGPAAIEHQHSLNSLHRRLLGMHNPLGWLPQSVACIALYVSAGPRGSVRSS